MAKPLSPEEVEAICTELKNKDVNYARALDKVQYSFLDNKPRIKNWQEFKTVQDLKTAMLSLHDKSDEVSVKVNGIEVTFVKPSKG